MSRSVLVSRSAHAGGPDDLELWDVSDGIGFMVPEGGFNPGQSSLRRGTSSSQYVRGRGLSDAIEDQRTGVITVAVLGHSGHDLDDRTEVLRRALRQWTYQIHWNYDGYVTVWDCEPADISPGVGQGIDEELFQFHWMLWTCTIPYITPGGHL